MSEEFKLPLLRIKDVVLFPNMLIQFYAAKPESINVIDAALKNNSKIFVVNISEDNQNYGTIANIKECKKLANNTLDVTIEGLSRGESNSVSQTSKTVYANLIEKEVVPVSQKKESTYKDSLVRLLEKMIGLNKKVPKELLDIITNMKELGRILDTLAINLPLGNKERILMIKNNEIESRALALIGIMENEVFEEECKNDINEKVIQDIKKQEKEYMLKRQLEKITEELGIKDEEDSEITEYRDRIEQIEVENSLKNKMLKEVERLKKLNKDFLEKGTIKNYLEVLLDLPWKEEENKKLNVEIVSRSLDKQHYGLKELKERVLEYAAVNSYKNKSDNMVLCLVGPPGVGKTSIAISIAKSLKRNYSRIPLGGMKDEAELRGHRRTYIGSMPGKIIDSFIETGVTNPVIIFDEIDKVSTMVKGDPYAVLLEVFDFEQNNKFRDYYIDAEYDISNALFICTANSLENIPAPLLDRMELVFIDGYSDAEKCKIVKEYLVPIENEKYGLKKSSVTISNNTIEKIIRNYTKESGIRELSREIEKVYRKAIKNMFTSGEKSVKITIGNLHGYLGEEKYNYKAVEETKNGEIIGLAWTAYGGKLLRIQVNAIEGCGQFRFTGKIGQVMNESAILAYTYLRMNAGNMGIDAEFYKTKDIHIHIPEGAIAKDGPSAGITLLCAMVAALKDRRIDNTVAMTGEITIKGDVIGVGGLKEKITAAIRNGVKKIIIPDENKKEVDNFVKENKDIEFIFVKTIEDVLKKLELDK